MINRIRRAIAKFKNPTDKKGQYFKNLFVGFDQLGNTIRGGDPDETISSDTGKAVRDGNAGPARRLLAKVLNFFDPNHVQDAIEEDEGKDEIIP